MGLDVIAYSKLRSTEDYTEIEEPAVRLSPSDDFPLHADGLKGGEFYFFSNKVEFRAGSYSSYNEWREQLCAMVHGAAVKPKAVWEAEPRFKGTAFYELIHFTDCDGVIGARTSAKLATDFKEYAAKAKAYAESLGEDDGDYFMTTYTEFSDAFALAADSGAVVFA